MENACFMRMDLGLDEITSQTCTKSLTVSVAVVHELKVRFFCGFVASYSHCVRSREWLVPYSEAFVYS